MVPGLAVPGEALTVLLLRHAVGQTAASACKKILLFRAETGIMQITAAFGV